MNDFKDRRLKYVELPKVFHMKANDVNIVSKQHLRICEKLAGYLVRQRPKTPKEFELNENLKDFVMKTAALNEKTIDLLDYIKSEIGEISKDATALMNGSYSLDTIRDQQESIIAIQEVRDAAIRTVYELRKKANLNQL